MTSDTNTNTMGSTTHSAKTTAASLASEANEQFTGLLNAQIDAGADLVDQVADAARDVADNLDGKAPQLAGMIRNAAQSAEEFAQEVRGRSVSEILEMTSQYARRQPAVFVGAAVASGFLLARFVKSSAQKTATSDAATQGRSPARSSRRRAVGDISAEKLHDA